MKRNILILGGSSEGFELAERLSGHCLSNDQTQDEFEIISSLAGRTSLPRKPQGAYRTGGFGGAGGLADFIKANSVSAIIDATHPFASTISQNAAIAAATSAIPCLHINRPPWQKTERDNWLQVPSPEVAAETLTNAHSPIFLTIGRLELAAFLTRPELRFLTRAIEPPQKSDPSGLKGEIWPANFTFIYGKGPFSVEAETALFKQHGIKCLVSKNSGSMKAYAKIEVARTLNIPVVMIDRPERPAGETAATVEEAIVWLQQKIAQIEDVNK